MGYPKPEYYPSSFSSSAWTAYYTTHANTWPATGATNSAPSHSASLSIILASNAMDLSTHGNPRLASKITTRCKSIGWASYSAGWHWIGIPTRVTWISQRLNTEKRNCTSTNMQWPPNHSSHPISMPPSSITRRYNKYQTRTHPPPLTTSRSITCNILWVRSYMTHVQYILP